jgi:hypothetical protein
VEQRTKRVAIQDDVKRSPRPPFVRTFTGAAAFVAASMGTACSGSSSAPSARTRVDTGPSDAPLTEEVGAGTPADGEDTAPVHDALGATTTTNPEGCPEHAPVIGDECAAGAIVCTYSDACPLRPKGTDAYAVECHLGKWSLVAPTYEAPCPRDIPEEDGPCLCGAHYPKACGFDICDVEGDPQLLAMCDEKSATWLIVVQECNPPPPGYDAGPAPDAAAD